MVAARTSRTPLFLISGAVALAVAGWWQYEAALPSFPVVGEPGTRPRAGADRARRAGRRSGRSTRTSRRERTHTKPVSSECGVRDQVDEAVA
ncbi:hypothetical protein [Nonomuraea sp. 10N515B]|uniref:hypothetical protein n=1 Tax=Nonomuraea sp. 10N515B TaxID=3457422 RepID=UPI003FCC3833